MTAKKGKRVVIVVDGGVVQTVACDDPAAEVYVYDWDNVEQTNPKELKEYNGCYFADLGRGKTDRILKEAKARLRREIRMRFPKATLRSRNQSRKEKA